MAVAGTSLEIARTVTLAPGRPEWRAGPHELLHALLQTIQQIALRAPDYHQRDGEMSTQRCNEGGRLHPFCAPQVGVQRKEVTWKTLLSMPPGENGEQGLAIFAAADADAAVRTLRERQLYHFWHIQWRQSSHCPDPRRQVIPSSRFCSAVMSLVRTP